MVGIPRSRKRVTPVRAPGAYMLLDRYGRVIETGPAPYASRVETTDDIVGNPSGQNYFDSVKHETLSQCVVNGRISRTIYVDYPSGYDQSPVHQPIPDSSIRGIVDDAVQRLSDSAPNEENVSIPNFLYELKDIPNMLRHARRRADDLHRASKARTRRQVLKYLRGPKARGEDWLNYVFGWDPLVNDIMDLFEVQKWLDYRMRKFQSYKRKGFIRTKVFLGNTTATVAGTMNAFRGENGMVTTTATGHHWAVARWKVTDPVLFEQPLVSYESLIKQSFGLDFNVVALWNALPWSWMIDWFSNVGSLLKLKQNRFGVEFDSAVRMTKSVYDSTMTPTGAWTGVSTSGECRYVSTYKKRRTLSLSIFRPIGMNYLSDRQLTTLSALAVTRKRG